jgi:hypothetical protein
LRNWLSGPAYIALLWTLSLTLSHQNHLLRLAREGAQTTVYHLKDFEVERRQATLVAILLDTHSTLIDEILDLHDRMIGSTFAKAKRAYETSFQEAGKAINEKVRLYAQVGQALIEAKDAGSDPFEAIERVVSWEQFTQSVQEAEKLARPEDFDYLGLLSNHYSQLRRYTPAFLEAFEFRAANVAKHLATRPGHRSPAHGTTRSAQAPRRRVKSQII